MDERPRTVITVYNAEIRNSILYSENGEWSPTVHGHFDHAERTEVKVRGPVSLPFDETNEHFTIEASSGPYADDAEAILYLSRNQLDSLVKQASEALFLK